MKCIAWGRKYTSECNRLNKEKAQKLIHLEANSSDCEEEGRKRACK